MALHSLTVFILLMLLLPSIDTFGIFFSLAEREALRGTPRATKEAAVAARLRSMGPIGDMYNCTCECDVRPFWIYEDVGASVRCGARIAHSR